MLALVCTITYSVYTEPGSCCGMQLCIADFTTLHCVPELQQEPHVYPEPQTHAQHSLPRLLCHDDLYCFCAFCHLNVSISQLHLDLGVSIFKKVHNRAKTALTISLPRAQAMQLAVTVTANGNGLGWYTCSAGCISSTVIPGLALAHDNQHEVQAGLTRSYLKLNVYTSMHVLKHML